jgi:hypothetical protein
VRIVVESDGSGAATATPGRDPDPTPPPDEEVDLSEFVDAPPAEHLTGIGRITAAFPGSELIEEGR